MLRSDEHEVPGGHLGGDNQVATGCKGLASGDWAKLGEKPTWSLGSNDES